MEKRDFFISYTKSDKEKAVWIAKTLQKHGYSTFIQAQNIHPGQNFIREMAEFLHNSRGFIAVVSNKYLDSKFAMHEYYSACAAWIEGKMDVFLPVCTEDCEQSELFRVMVHVNLYEAESAEEEESLLLDAAKPALTRENNCMMS